MKTDATKWLETWAGPDCPEEEKQAPPLKLAVNFGFAVLEQLVRIADALEKMERGQNAKKAISTRS